MIWGKNAKHLDSPFLVPVENSVYQQTTNTEWPPGAVRIFVVGVIGK